MKIVHKMPMVQYTICLYVEDDAGCILATRSCDSWLPSNRFRRVKMERSRISSKHNETISHRFFGRKLQLSTHKDCAHPIVSCSRRQSILHFF